MKMLVDFQYRVIVKVALHIASCKVLHHLPNTAITYLFHKYYSGTNQGAVGKTHPKCSANVSEYISFTFKKFHSIYLRTLYRTKLTRKPSEQLINYHLAFYHYWLSDRDVRLFI